MKHYSLAQWTDYVRGTAPKREKVEMQRHLEAGCKKCEHAVGIWTTTLRLAHKEAGYQPPDRSVRVVKSYFALCGMERKKSGVPKMARLIFDSFQHPQLAGVRSLGILPRHYIYQAGAMVVDVWMEMPSRSAPVSMTGQILEKSQTGQAVKDLTVKLGTGNEGIAITKTNQFGEFHLEIPPIAGPDLQLTIGDERKIAVLVSLGLITASTAGDEH